MGKHVVHLSSAHPRYDTRIFLKMCTSLSNFGFLTAMVVADGNGDEITANAVKIYDVGAKKSGRIKRMIHTVSKVFEKAIELDADIYHLHDPELIPIGLKLKRLGKIVIFDAHEDLPKQLRSKPYLNRYGKIILPIIFEWYERYACRKFDAIICATPSIKNKFSLINKISIDINNYPILGELNVETQWNDKFNEVCYLGGIAEIRGIKEVVKSLKYVSDVKLNLVGKFSENSIEQKVKSWDEWSQVNELGFLNRADVAAVLSRSKAGLVTFYDLPNHVDAQPNKMFEYMSAGLPIVTSNFPMWKDIVEGHECGICVDPKSPKQIGNAIDYILTHPNEALKMAENGTRAVQEVYNWHIEEKKLIELYKGLLK